MTDYIFLLDELKIIIGFPFCSFQELHTQKSTTYDVFKRSILPAVDIFMGGCNACVLIGGESGSGKSFSMAGDGRSKAGLAPMIMDHVFLRLAKGKEICKCKTCIWLERSASIFVPMVLIQDYIFQKCCNVFMVLWFSCFFSKLSAQFLPLWWFFLCCKQNHIPFFAPDIKKIVSYKSMF